MKIYQTLLTDIISDGTQQSNRTGVDAISIPGYTMKFDLRKGFPLLTTKAMPLKSIKGELIGFLRGYTNAADFRDLGCKIWDQNANDPGLPGSPNLWLTNPNREGEDDLGRIYGAQWRDWNADFGGSSIDQVGVAVDKIKNDPTNRRIIINGWRPDEFHLMALPPCHVLYQFIVDTTNNLLHLCMYQRSCDSYLGVPFNIASASLFLEIMAHITGRIAGTFTHFLADAHIYVNHLEKVRHQLTLEPRPLPTIKFSDRQFSIDTICPEDIELVDYDPHRWDSSAPMAV